MPEPFLMLPGDPGFESILAHNPPPDCKGSTEIGRTVVFGVDGMPRTVNNLSDLEDYLLGGEWDEVVLDHDDPFFEDVEL